MSVDLPQRVALLERLVAILFGALIGAALGIVFCAVWWTLIR